jgi:hypothetical protein
MPACHKVSVGWQIVFTFVTILNLWAFYRIRKLRKYLLYVLVPQIVVSTIFYSVIQPPSQPLGTTICKDTICQTVPNTAVLLTNSYASYYFVGTLITEIAFQALSIYLVIKWSREHNRAFETSSNA